LHCRTECGCRYSKIDIANVVEIFPFIKLSRGLTERGSQFVTNLKECREMMRLVGISCVKAILIKAAESARRQSCFQGGFTNRT
jgi:hypothetical protein